MFISKATSIDFSELIDLWKLCFNVDEKFINIFFKRHLKSRIIYILKDNGMIISSVTVFECKTNSINNPLLGGYIYGVCTHPDFQKLGYASIILNKIEDIYRTKCFDFLFLKPASNNLFHYYKKLGYTIELKYEEIILDIRNSFNLKRQNNNFSELTFNELNVLRGTINNSNYINWGEETLHYIYDYYKKYDYDFIHIQNIYVIGKINNDIYEIIESNLDYIKSIKMEEFIINICNYLDNKYPNIKQIIYHKDGSSFSNNYLNLGKEIKINGLAKLLKSNLNEPISNIFQNFPME